MGSGLSDWVEIRPEASSRLLDAHLARLDGALQGFPGERREQKLAGVQQQIAAIGPVQRAGLDQQEVGNQRTHLRDMLDPADQIAVGGVELLDDRRVRRRRRCRSRP